MSLSAPCSLLLEVCSILSTGLILGTCVSGRSFFLQWVKGTFSSISGLLQYMQLFDISNIRSFHGFPLMPWFWACTCNRVAPLTPFLLHNPHTLRTLDLHTVRLWLLSARCSCLSVWCLHTYTHTHSHPSTNIIHSMYTQNCTKVTPLFPVIQNNTSHLWALLPLALQTLQVPHSFSNWFSAVSFYLQSSKVWFSLLQFLPVSVYIRFCWVFTQWTFKCEFTLFKYNRIHSSSPSNFFVDSLIKTG